MSLFLAPGKLVVLGEYAVLDGAPALVAAVNHGVRCEVLPGGGHQTPGDDRFVREALKGAPRALYRFTDWNPVSLPHGHKAGFGGSAAATVAACLAGFGPEGLLQRAQAVHHAVQGSGSGIDVWASVHGGLRRWPSAQEQPPALLSAIYSGQSASTGPRVALYQAWGPREAFVERSAELLELPLLEALAEAYALLQGMARAAGIAYDTPAHRRIASLAREHGGAAKPSGAGGGDVAVAAFEDPEARAHFERACGIEGLPPIALRISPGARRVENHAS